MNIMPLKNNLYNISFNAHNVALMDNGKHSNNLQKLSLALCDDMDVKEVTVDCVNNCEPLKKMDELKSKLHEINSLPASKKPEYIAIPALMSLHLNTLNWCYNETHSNKRPVFLTPENLCFYKEILLDFLKDISENPKKYEKYMQYLDENSQGIEHTYDVIKEINKAVEDGVKVYIASSLEDNVIKWKCESEGKKEELYNYIATGNDVNKSVEDVFYDLKQDNFYIFNLLNLSDAVNVGVNNIDGKRYIYSGYDSCIDLYKRGVFNFSPVRKDGKIEGYSYLDEKTVHVPYEDGSSYHNIDKFTGMNVFEICASADEHNKLRKLKNKDHTLYSEKDKEFLNSVQDKLFKVDEIFSPQEIKEGKIKLKGEYVDSSLKLFFRRNHKNQIIFPNCDCEGSQRPSVCSMWGSCLAVIQAIADNINQNNVDKKENSFDATA